MQRLVDGIHHFQREVFASHQELFARLHERQAPETLFVTCSDSRINPNLITQTLPGELFILRNAGNLVPLYDEHRGGEAATIEFAVAALNVKDIIVCGHSGCGAMHALLHPERLEHLPACRDWLLHAGQTKAIIDGNYGHLEAGPRLTAAVEENVLVQLGNLRSHPAVAAGMASGRLHLHGWVYKIETGEVFAYDAGAGQFRSLTGESSQAPLSDDGRISELTI
ncbi:MAG: carbonic anhydrase [Holophagaceae bacterium]|nr:carbonic anhydrase [Holophagaceae bacterium]